MPLILAVAGVGGNGLSEDVAEHYKQLIRVQVGAAVIPWDPISHVAVLNPKGKADFRVKV